MRTRFYRAKRACLRTIWDEASAFAVTSTRSIETLISRLFRDDCRARSGCCSVDTPDPALGVCDVYTLDLAVEGERRFVVVVQRYR